MLRLVVGVIVFSERGYVLDKKVKAQQPVKSRIILFRKIAQGCEPIIGTEKDVIGASIDRLSFCMIPSL